MADAEQGRNRRLSMPVPIQLLDDFAALLRRQVLPLKGGERLKFAIEHCRRRLNLATRPLDMGRCNTPFQTQRHVVARAYFQPAKETPDTSSVKFNQLRHGPIRDRLGNINTNFITKIAICQSKRAPPPEGRERGQGLSAPAPGKRPGVVALMTDTIETLRERMEAAAEALDFEEAKRLRDRISLIRGGASADEADTSGLARQRPGAMGLGTSQQRVEPPAGWKPPPKPDPMTRGRGFRRR